MTPRIAFGLYNLLWSCAVPWLRLNHRLAEGFQQRRLKPMLPVADIWIQAASVGESYLALEIIKALKVDRTVKILVTSNTSQGIDILNRALADRGSTGEKIHVTVAYFPFDQPAIMRKAVAAVRPAAMVLLETEIWPGLLRALNQHHCKTIIINGRITDRSLKRYLLWPSIWAQLRPARVLAISPADADRFKQLFGPDGIAAMPNIKFDRVASAATSADHPNRIKDLVPGGLTFAVLASVRRQEEPLVKQIIIEILGNRPHTVIGLFPRHLHRIRSWQEALNQTGIRWSLRSEAKGPATAGTVIIWDTFGELLQAYQLCKSAFVGGSLAPLGGQNFLEALICGTRPVIGPSWENFAWVGTEIIDAGLLRVAGNWREVAVLLLRDMESSPPRDEIINRSLEYIKERQGGAEKACRAITALLKDY
ncbi:3-deoxy-D-manno-octulosonic acid transferase [Thermodesulfobacteriota bacterium]